MNLTMTVFLAAGAALLLFAVKKTNPGAVFLAAATGVAALFAADLALGFTHLNMPVNGFTVLCAALGGVPGVILLTLLQAMTGG